MGFLKKSLLFAVLPASLVANAYFLHLLLNKTTIPSVQTMTVDEPIVMRTKGGALEVSTIKATEEFQRAEIHKILGLNVGKTFARIRVPAVYRYHIELAPEWKILLRDNSFIVVAPPIKPSLPVAIDTAYLEAESYGRWSVFTGASVIDPLQRSITRNLGAKAATPRYIQLQREVARKTVSEFVAKWLVTQEQWKDVSKNQVRVFFSDEPIQSLGSISTLF